MKPAEVAELWGRFKSFEKRANELLKEDIDKYGYEPSRSAVRHSWDARAISWSEAAHDLYLWASGKDKDAIGREAAKGEHDYKRVSPFPPAVCVHVGDDDDDG